MARMPECGDGDTGDGVPRKRKVKNRILHLTELMPDATFQLVAQYGTSDLPMYVMEIDINGQVFQGIGPSKKRAKAMCADYALVHLGVLDQVDETPADMADYVDTADDFSADITDLSTQLYYDFSLPEAEQVAEQAPDDIYADDDDDDDFFNELDDMTLQLLGKNPVTIVGELRPDAMYSLLDETGDPLHPKFLMSVTIDEDTFQGSGPSKKLAKGRAARNALLKLYNLEFGTSENGMPIYEGDARIWQHFKAKLESKAQQRLDLSRDPVVVLQEYFPQVRFSVREPVEREGVLQFTTTVSIFDEVYEGVGPSKKDSKANAAANAINALRRNGVLAAKEQEIEADLRAAVNQPRVPSLFEADKKSVPVQRNAVAKLNLLYPVLEYGLLAEKPVRNTLLTAFVMSVTVEGRSFSGIGKTKKAAKVEAAEKALRYLRMWTKEDELAKEQTLAEDTDPVASISKHKEFHEAKKARLMRANWGPGPEGNFWGGPGQDMGWRQNTGNWGGNQMGWDESPGGWGSPQWGNRPGGDQNFMGGGGGNFNNMPEMGRGFGGDRGNFGPRRHFGNQGRGMGPRGFESGFSPRPGGGPGGGGGMDPRGGNMFDEGMQGDKQRFRSPGFGSPRGGFGPADTTGKTGPGRGGTRMTGAGGFGKRFPNSSPPAGNGQFGSNPVRPTGPASGPLRPSGVDASKPVAGGFRPPMDNSGNFRPGNPRTPAGPTKPAATNMQQVQGGGISAMPQGMAAGVSNTPNRGGLPSTPAIQAGGVGAEGYQYGMTGNTNFDKGTEISGSYQSSLGANRGMYYQSEGYQSSGMTGYQDQSMSNFQTGATANYQTSSFPGTSTVASSGYSTPAFQSNTTTSYNDPNYMTGNAYATGYYGGYSGTMGSVQGYGYEYMTGYQVPSGTTDPNYNMASYGNQSSVNSGYYPGYEYSQTSTNTGTGTQMDSYGTGANVMKNTW